MKYKVELCRTYYAFATVEIEAEDEAAAIREAKYLDTSDLPWSGFKSAEFDNVMSVTLTEEL